MYAEQSVIAKSHLCTSWHPPDWQLSVRLCSPPVEMMAGVAVEMMPGVAVGVTVEVMVGVVAVDGEDEAA